MKRFIPVLFGLVIVVVVVLGVRANNVKSKKDAIQTATIKREFFRKTVTASGKTNADRSVDLKFQTAGKLTWVGVQEGDAVSAYQKIAGQDTREVQKSLEKALRDYSNERNDFEETWRVTYQGKNSPDLALTDTVKRILQKNQWDLDKSVLDVELKQLAVEYATLVTPIAGIVTHIDTPVAGVNITPATAVFTIVDPASIQFQANIDETDVGSMTLGQSARITLDAFAEATFSGTVSYISYSAQTSSGGATVFPIKISFSSPQELRLGLNGDVEIIVVEHPDAIMVPLEAIREGTNGKFVYKKNGETYERTPITLGDQNDSFAVVSSGIAEGDVVVTKGFTNI